MDGKYWTAAGVTAGIDLGLRLCAQLASPDVAAAIELAMEHAPEPPFGTGSPGRATAALLRAVEELDGP